eukprot:6444034-Alexandrium_andersonii.AAC.1
MVAGSAHRACPSCTAFSNGLARPDLFLLAKLMRIQDPIGAAFLLWPRALYNLSLQFKAAIKEALGVPPI